MEDRKEQQRKELQEKIMAKRQQVDFEKTALEYAMEYASDNHENPDVSEEFKNFNDPAANVADKNELKTLKKAEDDLEGLIDALNKLDP